MRQSRLLSKEFTGLSIGPPDPDGQARANPQSEFSSNYLRKTATLTSSDEDDEVATQEIVSESLSDSTHSTTDWYRFDTDGPFFATLQNRGWHWASRSSWIDLLYLIYRKSRALAKKIVWRRLGGIAFSILSSFFLSMGFVLSTLVNEQIHPVAVYAWRQSFLIIYTIPMTRYHDEPFYFHWQDWKNWGQLALRTLFGSLNVYCVFKAITYITITDATVVSALSPILAAILAFFVLKEHIGITEMLCCTSVVAGVILISQPEWMFTPSLLIKGDVTQRVVGLLIALGGAVASACSTVVMCSMRSMHFSTVQIIYAYMSVLIAWPMVAILGFAQLPPYGFDKKSILVLIGLAALPMQTFYIAACQMEKASIVSVARTTTPVFSCIWQLVICGTGNATVYSLIGSVVVVCSVTGLALKRALTSSGSSRSEESLPLKASKTQSKDDYGYASILDWMTRYHSTDIPEDVEAKR